MGLTFDGVSPAALAGVKFVIAVPALLAGATGVALLTPGKLYVTHARL